MTNYVDRLYAALTVLAGNGHIKQRLIRAYEEHLVEIDEDELPVTLKQPFADLRTLMHRVSPHNGESPVCASVRKMSLKEASACAKQVVALYAEVSGLRNELPATRPLGDDEGVRVPPFLVKSV